MKISSVNNEKNTQEQPITSINHNINEKGKNIQLTMIFIKYLIPSNFGTKF